MLSAIAAEMRRAQIAGVLALVGINDPRTQAAIAKLTDCKYVFDAPEGPKIEDQKITAAVGGTIDSNPFKITVTLEGQITEDLQALVGGLLARDPRGCIQLPTPATQVENSDFLG